MRQFALAAQERKKDFCDTFATEPYETAWASEAIYFLEVEDVQGKPAQLDAKVQISPDGIRWIDEGTTFAPITEKGLYFVKVNHFGGWLRLVGDISDKQTTFKVTIRLALKE